MWATSQEKTNREENSVGNIILFKKIQTRCMISPDRIKSKTYRLNLERKRQIKKRTQHRADALLTKRKLHNNNKLRSYKV